MLLIFIFLSIDKTRRDTWELNRTFAFSSSNTTGAACGAGNADYSGAHEFIFLKGSILLICSYLCLFCLFLFFFLPPACVSIFICDFFIMSLYLMPIELLITSFRVNVMVFNATFNNVSALSWLSVLLVKETGVPQNKPTDKCCTEYTSPWVGFEITTLVVIGTDYTGS